MWEKTIIWSILQRTEWIHDAAEKAKCTKNETKENSLLGQLNTLSNYLKIVIKVYFQACILNILVCSGNE